jgi:ABC-type branched-subunit amino acid transport system permease subunit
MRSTAATSSPLGPRLDERVRRFLGSRPALVALLLLVLAALWIAAAAQGVPGQRILSLAVRGIMLGGILALGAIGLSLIFGVLRIPNFAHGDMMTAGAYVALLVAWAAADRGGRSGPSPSDTSSSSPCWWRCRSSEGSATPSIGWCSGGCGPSGVRP